MNFHTKMLKLKELFFQHTLRHWHFETLVKESGLSRERVNYFLKQLLRENFIKRVKPRNKMPYYIANNELPEFRGEKRLYGLQLLDQSGLFAHLRNCKKIKTAILFGSFARGDWNYESDIDLFIYGDDSEFEKGKFELLLKKELQIFSYQEAKEIKEKLDSAVIANIAKGFNITWSLEPFEVSVHV